MIRWALARELQAADVHAAGAQAVDLLDEHAGIDDDAVADDALLAGIEDPGGDQVELPRLARVHDGVPGVVAALEADDDVGVLGEEIDDLPLAFVAPLSADDDGAWHCLLAV